MKRKEKVFQGVVVNPGIAMGKLFFVHPLPKRGDFSFPPSISKGDREGEIARYRSARLRVRRNAHSMGQFLAKEGQRSEGEIFTAHTSILDDPVMTIRVEEKIRQKGQSAADALRSSIEEYFSKTPASRFRVDADLQDLYHRILRALHPIFFEAIPRDSIILAKELLPSKIFEAFQQKSRGFILEAGSPTSHTVLIIRSKNAPCISHVKVDLLTGYSTRRVILDGEKGRVIVDPSETTWEMYDGKSRKARERISFSYAKEKKKATTLDGHRVHLFANVESFEDLDLLASYGAEGIGLFRSECLFFNRPHSFFSEEELCYLYGQVISHIPQMPIVFRVCDFGGDKGFPHAYSSEPNPALGCRAIRFLLEHEEVFALHLRALLRVGFGKKLKILLPLISDVSEVLRAKEMMRDVANTLETEGYPLAREVPIGSMIEVPSAVIMCRFIARESDFLSIGTNDLMQYSMAMDRNAKKISPYYRSTHPSVLWMIHHVVEEAKKREVPVSLCGEMASDPLMVPLLLGLGIRQFSCAPRYLPAIEEMVSRTSFAEGLSFVKSIDHCATSQEVEAHLLERYGKIAEAVRD